MASSVLSLGTAMNSSLSNASQPIHNNPGKKPLAPHQPTWSGAIRADTGADAARLVRGDSQYRSGVAVSSNINRARAGL